MVQCWGSRLRRQGKLGRTLCQPRYTWAKLPLPISEPMLNCPTARPPDFLDPEEVVDSCGPAMASCWCCRWQEDCRALL